jgi:8-oxo-dGTP pyrophosphatase MutT (NUDIX family)
MLRRTDGEGWAFPGGVVEAGETPAKAAWREVWEECAYRLGDVGGILMRRVRDGVDFSAAATLTGLPLQRGAAPLPPRVRPLERRGRLQGLR